MPDNNQCNAWVRVMLDTLQWQRDQVGPEPSFLTEMVGTGMTHLEQGTTYTRVRVQERNAILQCLATKDNPVVLDFGCCVGRHSDFIHGERPNAEIWGVESEPQLLAVCQQKHGNRFVADWQNVTATGFDLVLLLGNNACIFGDEAGSRASFARLRSGLHPGGFLLGEFHPLPGTDHHSAQLRISYPRRPNPPVEFRWLFMSERWVRSLLAELNFTTVDIVDSGHGGARIFIAQKPLLG